MMTISNKSISELLQQVAVAYTLKGKNRFRIIAYQRAAEVIERLDQELQDMYENEIPLDSVPGIGASLAEHLTEYFKKPDNNYLIDQRNVIPLSVYELMKVPRIGPKNAFTLATTFEITDPDTAVDQLEKFAQDGKIAPLDGFGEKSQQEILHSIDIYRKRKDQPERLSLPIAHGFAQEMVIYLKQHPKVKSLDVLGSLRRWEPTIGDIDIAVMCDDSDASEILQHFVDYPKKLRVEGKGPKKASIIIRHGTRIDLETVSKEQYGAMLQYFTGNKDHNIKLREYALKKGYSINEYGAKIVKNEELKDKNFGKGITRTENLLQFESEELLYNFLGLDYIPPELRQGRDEIILASKKNLPEIISESDINGDFHIHTSFNIEPSHDLGADDVDILWTKARERNYDYIGFADHNPSVANHTSDQIISIMKERKKHIERMLNKEERCNYLISLETDIQPDGKLALPEEAFDSVDFLIVSVHSAFTMDKTKMTERILKALSYPKVKLMGHPTARLIGKREEIDAEWGRIFEYASRHHIAMEINAAPERLDLPEYLIRQAKAAGCKFILSTDSHAASHMDGMIYAVEMSRRAGLTKSDIINTWNFNEVKEFLTSG